MESTTQTTSLTRASRITVGAITVFAVVVAAQIAGGADNFPPIPPAIVLSVVVVGLMIWRPASVWTAALGALWPTSLVVGAAFNTDVYLDWISGREGLYLKVAAHLHVLALVVAMVAGVIALRQVARSR
ncbi:MAG: hypothetical protein GEU96_01140 [Propionibacteriales bacterium]|nr:hypothetical protein [Propionibacteriales bacterium]